MNSKLHPEGLIDDLPTLIQQGILDADSAHRLSAYYQQNKALPPKLNDQQLTGLDSSFTSILIVASATLFAFFLYKIPSLFKLNESIFLKNNVSFYVFPILMAYFLWKNKASKTVVAGVSALLIASIIFINWLSFTSTSILYLSRIHLVFWVWGLLGFCYVFPSPFSHQKRLRFLRYNAELTVLCAVMLLGGIVLTGLSYALFQTLKINIEPAMKNGVAWGLLSAPLIGTYLLELGQLNIRPIVTMLARIFSFLFLALLIGYAIALLFSGKNIFLDRGSLLTFNGLLIAVFSLIIFSSTTQDLSTFIRSILAALLSLALLINGFALSAIGYRLIHYGFTANRFVVLGGNILFFINLIWGFPNLIQAVKTSESLAEFNKKIAIYAPLYIVWALLVTVGLPIFFK